MNRDQYAERLRVNFDDAGTFYTGIDFNDSIQDCYDEIVTLSGSIIRGTPIPQVAGLSFYDLKKFIPDYLAVTAIWNSEGGSWLSPSSKREVESYRWDWTKASGNPIVFYPVNHRYVAVFPRPAVYNPRSFLYVFYRATADTLLGDSVPNFPQEYDHALESYCTADLMEQQLEYKKAALYFKEHQEHLKQLIDYIHGGRNPDRSFILGEQNGLGLYDPGAVWNPTVETTVTL